MTRCAAVETRNVNNNNSNNGNEQKETYQSNVSNNNNQIPPLTELAFTAFLRARKYLLFETTIAHDDVIQYYALKKFALPFLQCIADADPDGAEKLLKECPELAVLAWGTVRTTSGFTYQDVSAIQLAYLMDDDELMRDVLLPAIQKLSPEMIKEAETQLANKMKEVEEQRKQFKPYDFSEIVKAMEADHMLRTTGKVSSATHKAVKKFEGDFTPGVIKEGKYLIKEQLNEALLTYLTRIENKHDLSQNVNQLKLYLICIYGHLQTFAEKCFEQECSQGLKGIVEEKKPNARGVKIENGLNDLPLTYRGTANASHVLGRSFFVEMVYGCLGNVELVGAGTDYPSPTWHASCAEFVVLNKYVDKKQQQWEILSGDLAKLCINNQLTNMR
jgi:hypothetical protein